jgi:hypothetical protein
MLKSDMAMGPDIERDFESRVECERDESFCSERGMCRCGKCGMRGRWCELCRVDVGSCEVGCGPTRGSCERCIRAMRSFALMRGGDVLSSPLRCEAKGRLCRHTATGDGAGGEARPLLLGGGADMLSRPSAPCGLGELP